MENKADLMREDSKFLTFLIDKQEYGIHILEAREVVGQMEVDPVPKTPDFMKGVINLRGKIIPVIDLRTKFGMPACKASKENCILVVEMDGKLTGLAVDFLVGVVTVGSEHMETTPRLGKNIDTAFISGIAKLENRVVIILNMTAILSNEELITVEAATP